MSLRTVCLSIKAGASFVAGSASDPFAGRLEVLLSGDYLTQSHQCGGLKGKALDVRGTLSMHGGAAATSWARLRSTAAAGDAKLVVQGQVDWAAGDQLLIASTGFSAAETENRTVFAVRPVAAVGGGWDTELSLSMPLSHSHLGVTESHPGHELEMRAEVAVTSRPTISIRGVDNLDSDFRRPLAYPERGREAAAWREAYGDGG